MTPEFVERPVHLLYSPSGATFPLLHDQDQFRAEIKIDVQDCRSLKLLSAILQFAHPLGRVHDVHVPATTTARREIGLRI